MKTNFGSLIENCRERGQGYKVTIGKLGQFFIVDSDELIGDAEKSADCIFFCFGPDCLRTIIIEMRSKDVRASDVLKKMTRTVQLLNKILTRCKPPDLRVQLLPVVYFRAISPPESTFLKNDRNRVKFGKDPHRIVTANYETTLVDLLNRYL